MCGIAGIFHRDAAARVAPERVTAMIDPMVHRGPDGQGVHCGPGFGLGHRRLAIVDLAQGSQPMTDGSGSLWVTFNGEIYNHAELRTELEARGHRFRTRCDTEVLLYGYREWGSDLPRHLMGMFAFAIVDTATHTLFAARDRMGQKPLYYARVGEELHFASEPKGLLAATPLLRRLSPTAVGEYFCLGYVPDPRSIFANIDKLPPASFLELRDGHARVMTYWDPPLPGPGGRQGDLREQQEEVLRLLDASVRRRLMADVPLGAFLSGGVDSFAVVDSMRRVGDGDPVLACTIGFQDPRYDERQFARQSAAATGARLHEAVVLADDMAGLDWFADTFDEPFADSSAIPTYHVSRMARRHVTVALSGDGGDEGFAGYRRYRIDALENRVRSLLPAGTWRSLGSLYPKLDFLPRWLRYKRTLQNLACSPEEAYARSVSNALPEAIRPLLRPEWIGEDPLAAVKSAHLEAAGAHPLQRCMHADRRTWLPGDILTKVDRASMAVSLEVRSPFLDHHLVEFAMSIPADRQLLGGESKGFLRAALAPRLGRAALDRQKRGFSVPLEGWLRGKLADALDLALGEGPLADYADVAAVRRCLLAHRRGHRDHSRTLWSFYVFDRFLRRWVA